MRKFILISALSLSSAVMAQPYWQVSGAAGIAQLDAQNTIINVTEFEHNKAIQTNSDKWKAWTAQVGIGYVIPLNDDSMWFTSIEPQVNFYFLEGNINGDVDRYYENDVDYEDAEYQMDLDSKRLMLDLALNIVTWEDFSIYAFGGIGSVWNSINYDQDGAHEYLSIELDTHTDTDFAYELGGGLSYQLLEDIAFTVEYIYTDFSKVSLDDTSSIQSEDFNLSSQAVLLGFNLAL